MFIKFYSALILLLFGCVFPINFVLFCIASQSATVGSSGNIFLFPPTPGRLSTALVTLDVFLFSFPVAWFLFFRSASVMSLTYYSIIYDRSSRFRVLAFVLLNVFSHFIFSEEVCFPSALDLIFVNPYWLLIDGLMID